MVTTIGSSSLAAALVHTAKQGIESKKTHADFQIAGNGDGTDISASVAAYLSLPGYNAVSAVDSTAATSNGTDSNASKNGSSDSINALAGDDDGLKLALQQFDEGLKKLVNRPETQALQAKFGLGAANDGSNADVQGVDGTKAASDKPQAEVPQLGKDEMAADTNHDGKISEDERLRYQMPLTYRSSEHTAAVTADNPSAFSLAEANRAYGVVAKAAETA